jgi:anaerobic magnesium-protoporphyrin IX monomethyl ester cyclase
MKILLVVPKFIILPAGIAYISAALKNAGHNVDCYIFNKPDTLIRKLDNKYDFVATGGLSSQFTQIRNIVNISKQHNVKTIVGGGIITSEPELMSRALNANFVVVGEGEETVVQLLSTIKSDGNLSNVDGIGYLKNNEFILTRNRNPIENLDSLPLPDYDCFDFNRYLDSMKPSDQYDYDIFDYPRVYYIVTSRSCPFLCTFCYHPIGNKYRQRSIDSVMKEIETVVPKYHINIIGIYDELFSNNEERVREFCKKFSAFIKTIPWEVKWNAQMRVTKVKRDVLDLMKKAGCFMVSYGFESYSPIVLKSMKKFISPKQIHNAIHTTLESSISIQGNFIFGDKAETLQTAQQTLDFWKDHPESGILLGFIVPCPNSEIYQYCIKKGLIKDKLNFIKNHLYDVLNMTNMSDTKFSILKELVFKYQRKYYSYAIPLRITLTSVTIKCPHCKKTITYKNFVTRKLFHIKMMYCRNCRKRFFYVTRLYKIFAISIVSIPFLYQVYTKIGRARYYLRNILSFI